MVWWGNVSQGSVSRIPFISNPTLQEVRALGSMSCPQTQVEGILKPMSRPKRSFTATSNSLSEKAHPLMDMGATKNAEAPIPEEEFSRITSVGEETLCRFMS